MKTYPPSRIHCLAAVAALLAAISGCHHVETEEPEHHTPAHMPANYPAAVERLLALHAEINNGTQRPPQHLDVFVEASDVARWLPGLAADSDLEEQPWIRVERASRHYETLLADVMRRSGDERRAAYVAQETELARLQRELLDIQQIFSKATEAPPDTD
ncbi:hypothetical protein [Lignipirellula cremea]|uniref:Uncharacterized protein n=1 Tax=Lignipirellula cremea TaxID=2528010 RepID=A0A518E454_9BACT|nr:hypothetical protein [Lignipirellula cremea]QDU98847.1 hypothetical protein Pla8534_67580 [Lignipirellula cremea]